MPSAPPCGRPGSGSRIASRFSVRAPGHRRLLLVVAGHGTVRTEDLGESIGQSLIQFRKACVPPQILQGGHAVLANAAGDDPAEVGESRIKIDGDAVQRHPAAYAYTDRGDLVFAAIRAHDPDADPPLAPLPLDPEARKRPDDPFLQTVDIEAQVGPARLEIELDIDDALARAVVGIFAAAPSLIDRKTLRQQISRARAGPRGVERRMLKQPYQFRRPIPPYVGG